MNANSGIGILERRMNKWQIICPLVALAITGAVMMFVSARRHSEGDARAHAIHSSMTDEEILRRIGHDPRELTSNRVEGKDGDTTTYSNEMTEVTITRSVVSGTVVLRNKPESERREWRLGKL